LPGGIGTFTISHSWNLNQRLPKSEENVFTIASVPGNDRNGENPNFSPSTGSEVTLWDESVARKRNSRKEKLGDINVVKGKYISFTVFIGFESLPGFEMQNFQVLALAKPLCLCDQNHREDEYRGSMNRI